MTGSFISYENSQDLLGCKEGPEKYQFTSRDPERTPMQWNSDRNAGFSTAAKPYLPLASNYTSFNVLTELLEPNSYLKTFMTLMELRKNPTMKHGGFQLQAINDNILIYKRQMKKQSRTKNKDIFIIVLNFGPSIETVCVSCVFGKYVPRSMQVAVASIQSKSLVVGYVFRSILSYISF